MGSESPVIVAALRTPFGEVHGALSHLHPADLFGALLRSLAERAAIDPIGVDHLIVGCAMPVGAQADIGRAAVLAAGWADTIPAETITQHSSSSMLAVLRAAHAVRAGDAEMVIAGGVEVMSLVPMGAAAMARHAYGKPWGDRVTARYAAEGGLLPDDVRADALAREHGIDRGTQDAWALRSHARARAAREQLAAQLVAVDGAAKLIDHDERVGREIGDLAELAPMFDEAGTVTAANRAAIGDGAAVVAVTTAARAARAGWTPLCAIRAGGTAARGPRDVEPAATAAVSRVLGRMKVKANRLDQIELHESSAAAAVHIVTRGRFPADRVNPEGGSIAFGHPTGATGARLITALAHGLPTRGTVGLAVVEGEDTATAVVLTRD
jgi:acetyl-CoA acetyltransferase family protein